MNDGLYTEEVKKAIYHFKDKLPADFPLITDDRDYYLVIIVKNENFDWRTVEDRLSIAVELESLRKAIEGTGIRCVIEK